ncbi:hypothetical protein [Pseudanabaena cinerea]|uniref:hypothetical protein n=1 Tax=Pseudanabaena cinerea TaxID=2661616 RepID=UPI0018EFBCCD|nr:hypothetical protein [Pseudanabaena cinerea]
MLASEPSLIIDISEAQLQLLHLLDLAIAATRNSYYPRRSARSSTSIHCPQAIAIW